MTTAHKPIGLTTIVEAIKRGLTNVWPSSAEQKTWPEQVDLSDHLRSLTLGVREETITIDTGTDVFRIDIRHVQRRPEGNS